MLINIISHYIIGYNFSRTVQAGLISYCNGTRTQNRLVRKTNTKPFIECRFNLKSIRDMIRTYSQG